jgi:hypothetical protein
MLYLRRSQINVPRDRPFRETLPALNVAAEGLSKYEKRRFLRKLRTAKVFRLRKVLEVGKREFDRARQLVSNP